MEDSNMTNVFVELRPEGKQGGRSISDDVVEDHAGRVLARRQTQEEL
jgi:hypothetical protein